MFFDKNSEKSLYIRNRIGQTNFGFKFCFRANICKQNTAIEKNKRFLIRYGQSEQNIIIIPALFEEKAGILWYPPSVRPAVRPYIRL